METEPASLLRGKAVRVFPGFNPSSARECEFELVPVSHGLFRRDYRLEPGQLEMSYADKLVFHLPLFVFISGLFSKDAEKRRARAFDDLFVPLLVLQLIWLVWIWLAEGPRAAFADAFYPQFALWYLAALYLWRTLLPDLLRVRNILAAALVLFFVGKMVGGLDNLFGLDRALGFLVFFLLGYYSDGVLVERAVRRVPVLLAAVVLCVCVTLLWMGFSSGTLAFEVVFYTLTHSRSLWAFSPWWEGASAYVIALVGAVILAACFLRLIACPRGSELLVVAGRDTMPTYAIHGYVIHIACFLLAYLGFAAFSEPAVVALLLGLSVATTAVLSTPLVRGVYARLIDGTRRVVLGE